MRQSLLCRSSNWNICVSEQAKNFVLDVTFPIISNLISLVSLRKSFDSPTHKHTDAYVIAFVLIVGSWCPKFCPALVFLSASLSPLTALVIMCASKFTGTLLFFPLPSLYLVYGVFWVFDRLLCLLPSALALTLPLPTGVLFGRSQVYIFGFCTCFLLSAKPMAHSKIVFKIKVFNFSNFSFSYGNCNMV